MESMLLPVLLAAAVFALVLVRRRPIEPADHPDLSSLVARLPGLAYRCRLDRSLEFASRGASELCGHRPEDLELGGIGLDDLVCPEDRSRVEAEIAEAIRELRPYGLSYRILTADERVRWVHEEGRVLAADDGGPRFLEGFITDISDRKQAEDRLLHDALHDGLTGLPNRALLLERLAMAIRRAGRRPHLAFTLLYLDLDRFKVINESLGHEVGDQVLRITARRLEACLRQEDTVARLGGDDFAILLDDITEASDAVRVALRIGELLALPIYLGNDEVFTTASVGIASSLSGYEHPEEPLRDAEIAMYRAKAQGGSGHELFDRAMHQRALAQLRLETDLRRAIKREELALFYQPIVNLEDGQPRGFEALLRWHHPERGLVAPGDFLPTAMETGLIVPITWWALAEACAQVRDWQRYFAAAPPLYVSVNLTSQQFGRPDLVDRVEALLDSSALAPGSLHLEITENAVMDNLDAVGPTLDRLRELGVQLSLDDFGTGYSSLASLRRLPIRTLKIDRSFISAIDGKPAGLEIVRTIVALAHNLALEVVAEGVETVTQRAAVTELGCDFGQGFLFARPMAPQAVEELLDPPAARQLA